MEWLAWSGWDSVREWAVSIGGLVALAFAARTYAMNADTNRKQQARLVYTRWRRDGVPRGSKEEDVGLAEDLFGVFELRRSRHRQRKVSAPSTMWTLEILNGSDELIGPIEVHTSWNHLALPEYEADAPRRRPNAEDVRLAEGAARVHHRDLVEPQGQRRIRRQLVPWGWSPRVDMYFRDSSGRWWHRPDEQPIRRMSGPPWSKRYKLSLAMSKPIGERRSRVDRVLRRAYYSRLNRPESARNTSRLARQP